MFGSPYEICDPNATWKRKVLEDYEVKDLLVPIFEKGKLVYDCPTIQEIRKTCEEEIDHLWGETLRFENPATYYVDLSDKLWDLRSKLLKEYSGK